MPAASPAPGARERIIVALDVETAGEAREIVAELGGQVGAFKVGLQLFTAAGPEFVRELTRAGNKVFLDLKFHDIPNTVARASVEAARAGVWMFNVHALGGSQMMRQAVDETKSVCAAEGLETPLIIGVTVLTSSNERTLQETGVKGPVNERVSSLAHLSFDCGLDGVVASPLEVAAVREAVPDRGFLTVTPGIRPKHATTDDQKRVTSFREAIANGSDYVVVGRPIVQAPNRSEALKQMIDEVAENK